MPLWLILLVAFFIVVAAVALILSIHILETHTSQCLAMDALVTATKEATGSQSGATAQTGTEQPCCSCRNHGSKSGEESSDAMSDEGGTRAPGLSRSPSDAAAVTGKSQSCLAPDCLSGLTSRRSGNASGLRSGWLKTSRCFGVGGEHAVHPEHDDQIAAMVAMAAQCPLPEDEEGGSGGVPPGSSYAKDSYDGGLATMLLQKGLQGGAVSEAGSNTTGVSCRAAAGSRSGGSPALAGAMAGTGTTGSDFACVAEASAGSWGSCGASATATITATITATPSGGQGAGSPGTGGGSTGPGKHPASRRLVLEILMAPSNTPDGQGGSIPRATGVRLKLETNGGTETLEGLAALTGGSVGGDGSLTITGAEEIAALGLNVEGMTGGSTKPVAATGRSSAQDPVSSCGTTRTSASSMPSGVTSSVAPFAINKVSLIGKDGVGVAKKGDDAVSLSSSASKASSLQKVRPGCSHGSKGIPTLSLGVGGKVAGGGGVDEESFGEDPRAKKIAEEVAARKADMEALLAAARATAMAQRASGVEGVAFTGATASSKLGTATTRDAVGGQGKIGFGAGTKSSDVAGSGGAGAAAKVRVKGHAPSGPLMGSGSHQGSGINGLGGTVAGVGVQAGKGSFAAGPVKQEGLDSLRLSSGELSAKGGKVAKEVARGTADFASVLAALNVDSLGGKGVGLGGPIGPLGSVGGSGNPLARCGSSDSDRSGKGSADEAPKVEEAGLNDGSASEGEGAPGSSCLATLEGGKKILTHGQSGTDADESKKKDKKRGKNKRRRQKQRAANAPATEGTAASATSTPLTELPESSVDISLVGQKTAEVEVGCSCNTPKGFAHVMGCPYPFMPNMSNIQRKIKEQYDELVKANVAKSLTLAQVGRFTTCLVDAKNTIQHKSDIIQRRFTIVKSLLSKADKSNFDRLCGQIYGLEREQKQLEEDSVVYNRMQEQLKQSPAYQKMLEYGRTHFETLPKTGQLIEKADSEEQISFEELLAQEKKDAFWQKHSSRSSVHVL